LGIAPNLEELNLEGCTDMVELCIPAECPKLVKLKLMNLKKLRTLHLGITPNLEELSLWGCTDMVELCMPAECPKLVNLDLKDLEKLRTLHLRITPNLEELSLWGCTDMVELRMPAECPKLVNLDLYNCIQVAELPEGIGRLECLKELYITGTSISWLPESIFRIKGLRIVGSRWLLESYGFKSEPAYNGAYSWCTVVE
ncbi:Toll/interleukin-1 receptor domain-containing protein, partial [Tanacetum coccineum]